MTVPRQSVPLVYGKKRADTADYTAVPTAADNEKPPEIEEADVEQIFVSFEARRKPCIWLFAIGLAATVVAAGYTFLHAVDKDWAIAVLVVGGLLSYAPVRMLQNEFKDRLIPQILGGYGFTYDRKARRVRLADYADVLPSYTSSSLTDHFWGASDNIKMSVAELTLRRKSGKNSRTVFDGFLCRFDYPRRAKVEVAVKSDGGAIGQFFSGIFTSGERVKLEDPVFEERFDVYSSDQVAARYVLTPSVMQRLIDLERRHRGLRAIFRGTEILLAIPDGTDFFHPGSFLSPIDRNIVRQFHADMKGVFAFVDALKLDAETKI